MKASQQTKQTSSNALQDILGEFAYQQLAKNKLHEIAEDVLAQTPLSKAQAKTLLKIKPPLLLKLTELRKSSSKTKLLDPVLYLPLCSSLKSSSPQTITEVFRDEIQTTLKTLQNKKLHIAFDDINSELDNCVFIETLKNIFAARTEKIELIGLSAKTILSLARKNQKDTINILKQYSNQTLSANSLKSTELKLIKDLGFNISYSQTISNVNRTTKPREEYFINEIFELQKNCSAELKSWEPQFNYKLDQLPLEKNAALGLEVLTRICLARLILPQLETIKAPVAILGTELANVAIHFGANHLGQAAVDDNSAKNLNLPLYQIILKEIENV